MSACVLLLCAATISGQEASTQVPLERHRQAIASIEKLGGTVKIDEQQRDKPVAVILTGSSEPRDCLPYMKDLINLQTLDL